jgi:hypothetical protein
VPLGYADSLTRRSFYAMPETTLELANAVWKYNMKTFDVNPPIDKMFHFGFGYTFLVVVPVPRPNLKPCVASLRKSRLHPEFSPLNKHAYS